MNTQLLEAQQTRAVWETPSHAMLHERHQDGMLPVKAIQKSFFEDLECQMAVQEQEFNASLTMLRKNFIFKTGDAVTAFLKTHRTLIPILLEATTYLAHFFGADVPLALEIISDDGPPASINALALFHGNSIDARAALDLFDKAWWMANMRKASGRIVFDYDLV